MYTAKAHALIAAIALAPLASADPVTTRFPAGTEAVPDIAALESGLPSISIALRRYSPGPGIGTFDVPRITPTDGWSCSGAQTSGIALEASPATTLPFGDAADRWRYAELTPGGIIDGDFEGWGFADAECDLISTEQENFWTGLVRRATPKFLCSDCPQGTADAPDLIPFEEGVYYIPLRYRSVQEGEPESWIYGYLAFRIELGLIDPDCEFPDFCPDEERTYDRATFVGVSFETEPNTPVIAGAGLCLADLDPDAVLDLDDITAFVAAFIGGDDAADLNEDSVLDLNDVEAFVGAFNTGCGGFL